MDLDNFEKEIQYVIVNKDAGSNPETATLDLTLQSSLMVENFNQVIGVRIVDFYITNIATSSAGTALSDIKYIDIICRDLPKKAQILESKSGGQILCRVPLERGFNGSNSLVLHDKQWRRAWDRKPIYFNPISIKKLNFELKMFTGNGQYINLTDGDCQYYFTLEITTINNNKMI